MIFIIIKVICILMAIFASVTLFQAKIKLLGKILGSIVALLIALGSNNATLFTEVMYVLVNIGMLITTIYFRMHMTRVHHLK